MMWTLLTCVAFEQIQGIALSSCYSMSHFRKPSSTFLRQALGLSSWPSGIADLPSPIWVFVAKIVGAVAGSAISIVYVLPKGRREAASRFLVGVLTGIIFGTATGHRLTDYFDLEDALSKFEVTMIGATLSSLCAWWVLGVISKMLMRYPKMK